jgi:hypothetical protein
MLQMTWELDIEEYKKRGQRVDFYETKYPELIYPDGLFRIILNDKVFFEQPFAVLEFIRAAETWDKSKAMHYNCIETEDNPLISIIPVRDGWQIQSPWHLFDSSEIVSSAEISQSLSELSESVKVQLESTNQEVEERVIINKPVRQKLSIAEGLIAKPWILALVPFVYLLISLVLPLFLLADPIMVLFILIFANHIGVGVILASKIMAFQHEVTMKYSAFKELWMSMGQVKKYLRTKADDVLLERAEALTDLGKWMGIGFALSAVCLIVAAIATPV